MHTTIQMSCLYITIFIITNFSKYFMDNCFLDTDFKCIYDHICKYLKILYILYTMQFKSLG